MRHFLTFIILLALVAAGIPWVDGYFFKQQCENALHAFQQIPNMKQIKVKILDYKQGWLSSDVKVSYEYSIPNGTAETDHSMVLVQHITHGPLVYDHVQDAWVWGLATLQSDMPLSIPMSQQPEQVHSDTLVTFTGDYITRVTMPALSLSLPYGKLNWEGLVLNSILKVSGNQLKYTKANFQIGTISFQGTTGNSASTQNISLEYEVTPQPIGLPNGHYTLTIPRMLFTTVGMGSVTINNLSFSTLFNVTPDNLFNSHTQASLGQWVAQNYSISQSSVGFALNNLSAPAVLDYINYSAGKMTQAQLFQKAQALLTPKTSLAESVTLNSSFGKLISDGQVQWLAPVNNEQDFSANAKANLNLRISTSLVDEIITLMYPNDQQPAAQDTTGSVQPTEATIEQQIDTWVKQNDMRIDVGSQLKDLLKVHLATKVFATNVDQFVARKDLTAPIGTQLKTQYAQMMAPAPLAPATPAEPKPISKTEMAKALIANWLKQGYLTQDQDDYVTALAYEKNVLKANGVEIALPTPAPQNAGAALSR